ncbi:MAG: phage tail protein [Burkholderiales bacterium]
MTTGLVFQTAAPPAPPMPNRTDIACVVGFVARRNGVPLPASTLAELAQAGWKDGPWRRSAASLESTLQLPIAVESWETFDRLYAWDERVVSTAGKARCATYFGAAVRSFFARGGQRAIVVRVGDPWPYLEDANARAARRRVRLRALVPSFADRTAPEALFDATDPRTWRGIHHLYGLPDATLLLLPDLADACAADPLPPSGAREAPLPPEGFVECSEAEPALPSDSGLARLAAPRCDSRGYAAWRLALSEVREFITRHRRDCLFVGALPLPHVDARRPGLAAPVYAENEFLSFLRRVGVFEAQGAPIAPPASGASAFIQLGWPWLATRRSFDLPETLEPPDGLLAGVIASSALRNGTFRSIAGTKLGEVVAATPVPDWGLGPDSPAALLAERACLVAREPDGWMLVSDVTTSPDAAWRPAAVSRLVASVLRAARRLGEGMVFESNGPVLWARVRRAMADLLTDYWREGGLRGESSADAFDVRCDRSTMTQNDIDNGRLVAEVTLVPAAPVERITVVLALEAGGAASVELREVA